MALAMKGWQWFLIGWAGLAVVVSVPLGKLLKRAREQMEANEQFYKDQQRRNRSRWN